MSRNKKKVPKLARPKGVTIRKPQPIVQIIIPPADPKQGLPTVSREAWTRCLANRDGNSLANAVQTYLNHFEHHQYNNFGPPDLESIDEFMAMAYMFFTTPLVVDNSFVIPIVSHNHILQHVAAISNQSNTDAILRKCLSMVDNAWKIMALLNPRCDIQVPAKNIYDAHPKLATVWWNAYMLGISQPTLRMQSNLLNHFAMIDERWEPINPFVSCTYFTCTYHAPDHVRHVKGICNRALKRLLAQNNFLQVNNNPDPRSIAIVSNKWHRNHAVYKSAGPLVEQLAGKYKLTLIHTLKERQETLCTDKFDKVCQAYFEDPSGQFIMPPELKDNDFQLIYYPDIGMSNESIWMACARLAPIQVMGYGHPDTSGDGSEIDYIIGSSDTERDADTFYSETMVRIPGLAQEPAWPTYERKYSYTGPGEVVNVNCVWGPDKYNYSMLTVLSKISEMARRPHRFHFFMSPGANRYGALVPFHKDVGKLMKNVVIHNEQEYYDYMENAEQHDFSINSYPFGGYNTLVESLFLGLPFTTLTGNRFYNQAGSWLLDKVGFPELTCQSVEEFVKLNADLISDPELLMHYRLKLGDLDLKAILFETKEPNFLKAIEYILSYHPFKESVDLV